MNNQIMRVITLLKSKTGIDISIYSEETEGFFTTLDNSVINPCKIKFNGIYEDVENGFTYFRFRNKSEPYVGYISGTGGDKVSMASLIVTLLENGIIHNAPTGKSETLKSIILGECTDLQISNFIDKYNVPSMPCSVFVIYSQAGKCSDIIAFLENFKDYEGDMAVILDENNTCAYIRFKDENAGEGEYQSSTDYAYLLVQSIQEELSIKVKIGVGSVVKDFINVSSSFDQAVIAFKMGSVFSSTSDVSTYKEYALVKILEDLPKYKLQELFDVLSDPETKSVLSDDEMINTAEEFLQSSLNISETSRKLYMHRNTLMYRLDKIEKSTGLDIRQFQDAMTFKLIMQIYKLIN